MADILRRKGKRVWERKKPRRDKPYKKVKFYVWFDTRAPAKVIECPRCGRDVDDTDLGRRGHGSSCVKIPERRPKGWGVKTRG